MNLSSLVLLGLQISIIATVFSFGLGTTREDLTYLFARPGLLIRSLLAIFVITPVIAVVVVLLFDLPHAIEVVLVALAVSPVPPLLPNRESKHGRERPFGLALMAVCALLAIVLVPLALTILARVIDRPLGIAVATVARILIVAAILPLLAGVGVRLAAPAVAQRLVGVVSRAATVLLVLSGVALLVALAGAAWAAVGNGTVLALAGFVLAGLAIGHVMGGPVPEHSVVLALSTACRHPAIALALASANFPHERFGGMIALYLLVNLVVGAAYLAWAKRRFGDAVSAP
jgi:BASS family bile acid:Na+ symporter